MSNNNKQETITLQEMIDHFDTVARFGAKNGQPSGMYGQIADKLRRLAMLEDMIASGKLVEVGR